MKRKRQIVRRVVTLAFFLLMPLIMKFFSPIMTIKTAMVGVVSASILTIALMFGAGMFTGRLWCGWVCPAGGIQDVASDFIGNVKLKNKLRVVKYILAVIQVSFIAIFLLWIAEIVKFDYFYSISIGMTSVDIIFYYIMIALFFVTPFFLGKRAYCNVFCVIAPVMTLGKKVGEKIGIRQRKVVAEVEKCTSCKLCDKHCPVGLTVSKELKCGSITHNDCISCMVCIDVCPKKVLSFKK